MPYFIFSKGKVITMPIAPNMFWLLYILVLISTNLLLLNLLQSQQPPKCPSIGQAQPGLRIFGLVSLSALRTLLSNICMTKFIISFNFYHMSPSQWDLCPPKELITPGSNIPAVVIISRASQIVPVLLTKDNWQDCIFCLALLWLDGTT